MSLGKKIASAEIKNRTQTPFFSWLRNKLLAIDRDLTRTPPPGIPNAEGKCVYNPPNRFPNTQASRSPPPPNIPGGVYHQIADNYYYGRDARRLVEPPTPSYKNGQNLQAIEAPKEALENYIKPLGGVHVNLGPKENYGLIKAVTPGFGYQWKRVIENEEFTQKKDPDLALAEKYDGYRD